MILPSNERLPENVAGLSPPLMSDVSHLLSAPSSMANTPASLAFSVTSALTVVLVAALTACAGLPGNPEPIEPAATIEGEGSSFSLCGFSSNPICKVGVSVIDGKSLGTATSVRVLPGRHDITVFCFYRTGLSIGDMKASKRSLTFSAAPSARYRVHAEWTGSTCAMKLVDQTSGAEVPKS